MSKIHLTIPTTGFLRLPQILAIFPVGKSSWWEDVAPDATPNPSSSAPALPYGEPKISRLSSSP